MQRGKRPISRLQWLLIIIVEIFACLGVGALTWQIFVNPKPPDFSALLASPTRFTSTPTVTFTPTITLTASPLPALLSTTAAPEPTVVTETPVPVFTGTVIDNGDGLNIRNGPSTEARIVARLLPNTPLTLLARSADGDWLQVIAATGDEGWVSSPFVVTDASLDLLPVATAVVQPVAQIITLTASKTPTPSGATPLPTSPITNGDYPYILGVGQRARDIFLAGQAMGNRPGVFSKVGDSITERGRTEEDFLMAFGRGSYNLGEFGYLQPVIDFFLTTEARLGNSFVNDSLSAAPGWSSWTAINFHASDDSICAPLEIPIECELRMIKPSVALIMLGTNDVPDTGISATLYETQMRKIIETSIRMGVVPVLSTIPQFKRPDTGYRVAIFNDIIVRLSDEYQIPLWHYAAAIEGLPNNGLGSDGVHPSIAPASSADFSTESLQYGMNVRNLTALQALDAIWREVILD
jgi:SH3-like domain-containing protein